MNRITRNGITLMFTGKSLIIGRDGCEIFCNLMTDCPKIVEEFFEGLSKKNNTHLLDGDKLIKSLKRELNAEYMGRTESDLIGYLSQRTAVQSILNNICLGFYDCKEE